MLDELRFNAKVRQFGISLNNTRLNQLGPTYSRFAFASPITVVLGRYELLRAFGNGTKE